ncbi:DnaB-like helicase N-terminal domain-containing protein [Nostoc sp. PCC 7107]|uniref:AAA family ATPase n=1 Tax=Nostoc sp. PCC 7107 TaxID=317936 RepID=UPI00029F319E|nr:DnaB-like helicase N-terminal domain-containing protein [Nostoc sp. PCC 7107]AFY43637.1 DnaB domain protein helicase domain protein [Nostoc sp. PCC 7107]
MVAALDFKPSYPSAAERPPANLEAEEAVLGMILFNPEAIYRVADFLPVEAFYISPHKEIYKAALSLQRKKIPVTFLTITDWLEEKKLLLQVGGRNKLYTLVSKTVSDINLDHLAWLLVDKYINRQLLSLSNEISHLVFESEIDTPQKLSKIEEKVLSITECPLKHREDDYERWQYNNLIKAIREIESSVDDPGLKMMKMHNLAKKHGNGMSPQLLETIYYKSLLNGENEPAMTLSEFEAKYGQLVNEWHMNGLLPKGKVVLLYAKGGEGKTRIAYELGLHLATGQAWSGFPVNGKCKLLYVQTDESPNDTLSVLKSRGYENSTEIHLKSRWTVDHTESLKKEIQRLGSQFILIDSLSSVNKNSLFSENDVEYARPILRLKEIAQELGVTILIIHHANKEGDTRGSSAIFASVSEVWKLARDVSADAPSDGTGRLLTIEKSRSRAPATYKLQFCPEDKSWICLGKEGEMGNTNASLKDAIIEFLEDNRGTNYEAEEITHELRGHLDSIRRALFQLAEDGIIYKKELIPRKGKPQKYYLPSYNRHTASLQTGGDRFHDSDPQSPLSDHTDGSEKFPPITRVLEFSDHGINYDGSEKFPPFARVSEVSDPHPPKNTNSDFVKNSLKNSDPGSALAESHINQAKLSDPLSDPVSDPRVVDQKNRNIPLQRQKEEQEDKRISIDVKSGTNTANIAVVKRFKRYIEVKIDYVFADNSTASQIAHPTDLKEAQQIAMVEMQHWESHQPNATISTLYRVRQLGEDDFIWVENCQLIDVPQPPIKQWYVFQTAAGKSLQVRGADEFELMPQVNND